MTPVGSAAPSSAETSDKIGARTSAEVNDRLGPRANDKTIATSGVRPRGPALPGGHAAPGAAMVRWVEGAPLVVLRGDLDVSIAGQLAGIGRLLRTWDAPRIAQAAGVTFIDAGGLRAVLSLGEPGAAVHLWRPSAPVVRLLQVLTRAGAGVHVQAGQGPAGTVAVRGLAGW